MPNSSPSRTRRGPPSLSAIGERDLATLARRWSTTEDELTPFLDSLSSWEPSAIDNLLRALAEHPNSALVPVDSLKRWVDIHDPNDYISVVDCATLNPPPEVTIHQVLSRKGSQKIVFKATWNLKQRPVVVKKIRDTVNAQVVKRELHPHPLSMVHPNIIETHLLRNANGHQFLVERQLPEILDDSWSKKGLELTVNLLRDMLEALVFLRREGLVHGDIKPWNIGREGMRFILLDFGICRKAESFGRDSTPTGSLRTRAPELLTKSGIHTYASDVWAVGATVFNVLFGRFPLMEKPDERIPRTSEGEDKRAAFEAILANRVQGQWDVLVEQPLRVSQPTELAQILKEMLAREPTARPAADQALEQVEDRLRHFLVSHSERRGRGSFALKELRELIEFYSEGPEMAANMPLPQLYRLNDRLRDTIDSDFDLSDDHKKQLKALKQVLSNAVEKLTHI